MKTISSRQNPLIRRVREAIREHAGEIVIEGPKQVADAIASGWRPIVVMTRGDSVTSSSNHGDAEHVALSADVFDSIASTRQPQHAIALFERRRYSARDILANQKTVAIALDGVQDPGNVGTIVRLAAAFDAAGILLLPGCADPLGPKAIRSSAGAILSVPVAETTVDDLIASEVRLIATAMDGDIADPPSRNAVLVFGNEGAGVSPSLLARATRLAIPMSQRVESLNVASSAAILLARSYALRT